VLSRQLTSGHVPESFWTDFGRTCDQLHTRHLYADLKARCRRHCPYLSSPERQLAFERAAATPVWRLVGDPLSANGMASGCLPRRCTTPRRYWPMSPSLHGSPLAARARQSISAFSSPGKMPSASSRGLNATTRRKTLTPGRCAGSGTSSAQKVRTKPPAPLPLCPEKRATHGRQRWFR